ncbi:MAG: hypothetical protein AAGN35_01975 [Bacteroidota bacterium]
MARPRRYRYAESLALLRAWRDDPPGHLDWDRAKQKLTVRDDTGVKQFTFRLPLPFPPASEGISLAEYLEDVPETPPPYLLLLLQAGHSALGYFEEGEVVYHKVIKKYMVRARQGKAQIGYLNTRGKSKAGSRVRLANTISFFEAINAKVTEWDIMNGVERILLSCPVRMKPLLFQSKVPPPFTKDDPRLLKVPLDIHRPDLEELKRVNRIIQMGERTEAG